MGFRIKPERRPGWHRKYIGTISIRHSPELISRHTLAGADQPVEAISAFGGVYQSVCQNGNGLGRVVETGIKIYNVIRLGVDRYFERIASAQFETEFRMHFPAVGHVGLNLSKPEKANRIVLGFAVGSEVAQQGVGKRVAGRVSVPAGIEGEIAGVSSPPVLVLAVSHDQHSCPERVLSAGPADVVAEADVSSRREQRTGGPGEACEVGYSHIRYAVFEPPAAGEKLWIREAVRFSLPGVSNRGDSLAVPGGIDLCLVDQCRADHPCVRHLIAESRT